MNSSRALLVEALFPRDPAPGRLRSLESRVHWRRTVDAAARAGILPMLHRAVMVAGSEREVPAAELHRLVAASTWTAVRAARLVGEAAQIQEALRDGGVESVVLKGVALAALDPKYGALRLISDIDLLIRRADLVRCEEVLLRLGCTRTWDCRAPDGRPFAPGGEDRRGPPHVVPYRTRGGELVEPHYDLPGRPWNDPAELEAMWARTTLVRAAGGTLRVPSLEDLLGIACHHALGPHAGDTTFLVRHVADVHVLASMGADVERSARWYDRSGAAPVRSSLALAARTRAAAGRARWWLGPVERAFSPGWAWASRRAWVARNVFRGLRAHGARALFPSRAFMAARYRVRPDSRLVPFLHIRRLLRAMVRVVARM